MQWYQRQRSSSRPQNAKTQQLSASSEKLTNTTANFVGLIDIGSVSTLTVWALAPLPCRIQGSITATATCLFIPAAAAAILGRQRRGLGKLALHSGAQSLEYFRFRSVRAIRANRSLERDILVFLCVFSYCL